jgi:hypothetical protein
MFFINVEIDVITYNDIMYSWYILCIYIIYEIYIYVKIYIYKRERYVY